MENALQLKVYPNIQLTNILVLLGAAFCLMIPALYNSYPLVTSDSGAYINNGWIIHIPQDRPLGYSLLIRLASLSGISLWGVVIVQSLLVAFFLQLITRYLLGINYHHFLFLGISLLLGVATSAGWFAGQIMPDIFTALLLLSFCVLFFIPIRKTWWLWALYIFIWGCILLHNSNLLITLVLGASILLFAFITKRKDLNRPSTVLIVISVAGWITLSTLVAISGRGFRPSSATHVFIMSRMVENGILDAYLNERCATENYKLCEWRDKLPDRQWDFMWDDSGALAQTGGWIDSEEEYSRIIQGTLVSPKFLGMHIVKNSLASLRQLPLIFVGDGLSPWNEPANPFWKVQQYFSHELKEYRSSLQQTGALKFEWFNVLIVIFSLLTITSALIINVTRRNTTGYEVAFSGMFKLVLLFLIINAAVTATFSTVNGRFQSRVFWVLVFLSIVYLFYILLNTRKPGENQVEW